MEGEFIILDDQDRPLAGFIDTEPVPARDGNPPHVYGTFEAAWEEMQKVNDKRFRAGLGRISFALCVKDGRPWQENP